MNLKKSACIIIQPWCTPFPVWNQFVVSCPILTVIYWPAYRFLRRQLRWSGIPISLRIVHSLLWSTVKGFSAVNEAELMFFWLWKVKVKSLSCVRLFATPWTVAYEVPPSMEFSRREYWSRLPFPSPKDLPHPGIEPRSPKLQADTLTIWATRKAPREVLNSGWVHEFFDLGASFCNLFNTVNNT